MKLFAILAAMMVAQSVSAQDFCKDIKKTTNDAKTLIEFESPYNEKNEPIMRVKRTIVTDDDETIENFVMVFRVLCTVDDIYATSAEGGKSEKAEKSLTVVFTDNSKIVDDTVEIMHDLTPDRTEAIRYVYYPITADNVNDFSGKKIARFVIAGQEIVVPEPLANTTMNYTRCIKTSK